MDKTKTTIYDCKVLTLGKIHNTAGNITVMEGNKNIHFDIKRVYFLYDIPSGAERGGHAHKALFQLVVAASGSFDMILDDAKEKKIITLNQPDKGLLIVPGIWRELTNFSSGAICLVLTSEKYDEKDYIRNYNEFIKMKKHA